MSGRVSVIIVNYRTPELTIEAAQSALNDALVAQVVIVNSVAEGDEVSVPVLQEFAEGNARVTFVPLSSNPGFGTANNRGVDAATAEYIFLLNSDATLESGALAPLVHILDEQSNVGLVAPPVYLPETHVLQPDVCGIFPTPMAIITRKTTVECTSEKPDWISGVAFLARREEFNRLGGFDEQMFMYYEDVELSNRYASTLTKHCARLSTGPGVVHLGGASKSSTANQKKSYYRSQDYYLKKVGTPWFGRITVILVRSIYVLWKR